MPSPAKCVLPLYMHEVSLPSAFKTPPGARGSLPHFFAETSLMIAATYIDMKYISLIYILIVYALGERPLAAFQRLCPLLFGGRKTLPAYRMTSMIHYLYLNSARLEIS